MTVVETPLSTFPVLSISGQCACKLITHSGGLNLKHSDSEILGICSTLVIIVSSEISRSFLFPAMLIHLSHEHYLFSKSFVIYATGWKFSSEVSIL